MPDRIEVFSYLLPVTRVASDSGALRVWCAPWDTVQVVGTDYGEMLPLLRYRLEAHLIRLAFQRPEAVNTQPVVGSF